MDAYLRAHSQKGHKKARKAVVKECKSIFRTIIEKRYLHSKDHVREEDNKEHEVLDTCYRRLTSTTR